MTKPECGMTKETLAFGGNNTAGAIPAIPALNANRGCHNPGDFEAGTLLVEPVAGTLMCGGKTAGSATTQDAPLPFDTTQITSATNRSRPGPGDPCHPLAAQGHPPAIAFQERLSGTQCVKAEEVSPALGALNPTAVAFQPRIARNGRGDMGDLVNALNAHSGTTGKGDAAPCVAVQEVIGFKPRHYRGERKDGAAGPITGPLTANAEFAGDCSPHVAYALHSANSCAMKSKGKAEAAFQTATSRALDTTGGFSASQGGTLALSEVAQPLRSNPHNNSDPAMEASMHVLHDCCVRRLTPEECELLQGFPIGYTLIPGKHRLRKGDDLSDSIDYLMALGFSAEEAAALVHCPDGPRYKALGNSWAVPCVRWIGARITAALDLLSNHANP